MSEIEKTSFDFYYGKEADQFNFLSYISSDNNGDNTDSQDETEDLEQFGTPTKNRVISGNSKIELQEFRKTKNIF